MKAALLNDRGVLRVTGEPARGFLNGLVTCNVEAMSPGTACYAALLTPQGKVIADFLVVEAAESHGGGFFIDCPQALAGEVAQKLNFYKLRSKVSIEPVGDLSVLAIWEGDGSTEHGLAYRDPRLPGLGWRVLIAAEAAADVAKHHGATRVDASDYEAHRIALGVPRGGADFIYGDVFPHDIDMDKLNGVDFRKGCFVGQEVVSRVEHRGTARNRIVPVAFDDFAAQDGTSVMAGDKTIGTMGSSAGPNGLAMLRVDRVAEALESGASLSAGGIPMRIRDGFFDFLPRNTGISG